MQVDIGDDILAHPVLSAFDTVGAALDFNSSADFLDKLMSKARGVRVLTRNTTTGEKNKTWIPVLLILPLVESWVRFCGFAFLAH